MRKVGTECVLLWASLSLLQPLSAQQSQPLDFGQAHWLAPAGDAKPGGFVRRVDLAGPPAFAQVLITADAGFELYVNGITAGNGHDWGAPQRLDVLRLLHAGANILAVKVEPGDGGRAALLAAMRVVTADGALLELSTDTNWTAGAAVGDSWERAAGTPPGFVAAADLGAYGVAPWGRLTRMSLAEGERAMGEVNITIAPERDGKGRASLFKGAYLNPSYARRYAAYATVDRDSGRFRVDDKPAALCFVRYSQPGLGLDHPLLRATEFDFDLFEADLTMLERFGLQVALQGFGWADLLAADGTWAKVEHQPKGTGLPTFEYRYEILDYALDRVQAHGLLAMILVDYRQPLPKGVIPDAYGDKLLLAPNLWTGVVRAQAKIVSYFAARPVIAGWSLATDGLPSLPPRSEPLLAEAFREYLQLRYINTDGLRKAWGTAAVDINHVGVPDEQAVGAPAADLAAFGQRLLVDRVNSWVEVMRAVDPHHLFAFGDAADEHALLEPQRLRFDLYGPFCLHPKALDPASDSGPPSGVSWALARSVRALPHSTVVATLTGRYGAGSMGSRAGRAVLHDLAEAVTDGATGCITAPTWDRLTARGSGLSADTVTLARISETLTALQRTYLNYPARVLVVRNDGAVLGADGAAEERSVAHLGDVLDALHMPFDVIAASAVGGPDETYRVNLGNYRVVLVPTVSAMPDDSFWSGLETWLNQAPRGERALVVGRVTQAGPLSPAATRVLGAAQQSATPGAEAMLRVLPPIATLPGGRQLAWPAGGIHVNAVAESADAKAIGTLRDAGGNDVTVLTERHLAPGREVVAAGFDLGLGEVAAPSPELWDTLSYVTGGLLADAGIAAPVQSAAGLDVHLSEDGQQAVIAERFGRTDDVLWSTGATRPESIWGGAETRLDDHGTVTVSAPMAPYQVKVLSSVGELHGVEGGQKAVVRAAPPMGEGVSLSVQAPLGTALRVRTRPGGLVTVAEHNGVPRTVKAGDDGMAEIEVTEPKQPLSVMVYGSVAPPSPMLGTADYLAVAEDRLRHNDVDGAVTELARLSALYAGSDVARAADKRRDEVVRTSGAVVFVNETDKPMLVAYRNLAPTPPVLVEAGGDRRVILAAGSYQESIRPLTEGAPAVTTGGSLNVAPGQALVREFTGATLPADLAKSLNLHLSREALTEPERLALTARATQVVTPSGPAPAEAGTGTGAGPGTGTGTPTGPAKPVAKGTPMVVVGEVEGKKGTNKTSVTRFTVRNQTKLPCILEVEYYPLPPNQEQTLTTDTDKPVLPGRSATCDIPGTEGHGHAKIYFPDVDVTLDVADLNTDGSQYQVTVKAYTPEAWKKSHHGAMGNARIINMPGGNPTAPTAPAAPAAPATPAAPAAMTAPAGTKS